MRMTRMRTSDSNDNNNDDNDNDSNDGNKDAGRVLGTSKRDQNDEGQ